MWCIKEMKPLLPEARDDTTNPPNLLIMSNLFVPGTVRALSVSFVILSYFLRLSFSATTSSHEVKIRDIVFYRLIDPFEKFPNRRKVRVFDQ
jgi:hypothetical protein